MNYINKRKIRSFWKYDLRDESIAAAVAGMSAYTELDRRCIVFTIHLQERKKHDLLCQIIFEKTEKFLVKLGKKRRSASHSGIASFVDVNGSKFGGADRDLNNVHCHGCIFIPHGITDQQVDDLVISLILTTKHSLRCVGVVKTSPNAIHFARFQRKLAGASLKDWVGYCQKDATRLDVEENIGVFLPFDTQESYGLETAKKMARKRDIVLGVLRSSDSFKVFR